MSPKKLGTLITGLMILPFLGLALWNVWAPSHASVAEGEGRTTLHWDQHAATEACRHAAAREIGNKLLRTHVDQHSTRYDEKRGIYLVVLKGSVGSLKEFEEATIYCYLEDPTANDIENFYAYDSQDRELDSRSHFDKMMTIFK